jgi:hypothetical protein
VIQFRNILINICYCFGLYNDDVKATIVYSTMANDMYIRKRIFKEHETRQKVECFVCAPAVFSLMYFSALKVQAISSPKRRIIP